MHRNSIGRTALYSLIIILAILLVVGSTALIFHMIGVGTPDNGDTDTDTDTGTDTDADSEFEWDTPPENDVTSADGNDTDVTDTESGDSDSSTETSSTDTTVEDGTTVTIYDTPKTMYALYNVNARMSYTTESDIYGLVYQGETVSVTGETDNGWYRVDWRGYVAYVRNDLLTSDSSAAVVTIEEYDASVTMFANANVNVRESYSTNSNKLTMIEAGTEVTVTGKTANGWYRIVHNDGVAYIKSEYLSHEKPTVNTEDGQ